MVSRPASPFCVYCRQRPVVREWRPFCSERCKTADLGRWLTGGYRVAGPAADPERADSQSGPVEDDLTPDHED
jgi:uncharacterized protein